jgi:hypothetical protein
MEERPVRFVIERYYQSLGCWRDWSEHASEQAAKAHLERVRLVEARGTFRIIRYIGAVLEE